MELNKNEIADIVGKAVGEAVAPLYERMNILQEAISKPQQVEEPKQENKEPEFPHDVWERATEMAKAQGRF